MSDAPDAGGTAHDPSRRRAFLLNVLAGAPSRSLKRGQITPKLRTGAATSAGLTPADGAGLLDQLAAEGLVALSRSGRAVTYSLTDSGAEYLDRVRDLLPPGRSAGVRGKVIPPANDQVRAHRIDFLLLQVLRAPRHEVTEADANAQLDAYARDGLELNAATATSLRRELAEQGLLAASGSGRATRFRLTAAGRVAVGNATFPPDRTFTLPGRLLNDLLEAAREVGKQFTPVEEAPGRRTGRADLSAVIVAAFEGLLRERYQASGLVPVADVRAAVRARLGDEAARHDVFDDAVLGLWRAGRVQLTPIFDPAKAAPDQVRDAIPGVGETLFYLEAAREPAHV